MCDLLWKCCKNIVDMTTFFFYSFIDFVTFFSPIFGNAITTIVKKKKFIPLFWQWHCHNSFVKFLFFIFSFSLRALHARTAELGRGNSVSPLPKFNIFSVHLFLLLSHTFGWILATIIPKFNLSPQNPK